MRKLTIVSLILTAAILLTGCGLFFDETPPAIVVNQVPLTNSSPNWSFVALTNASGMPSDPANVQAIGNAILNWEESNPGRRIVTMQIIYQPRAYSTSPYVSGISIYSEAK